MITKKIARLRRWLYSFRPCNMVDLSVHQDPSEIDYHALRRAGIVGAYIRSSAGSLSEDRAAEAHAVGCSDVGIETGYYHAVSPDDDPDDPEREARFAARCQGRLPPPQLLPAVDVERGKDLGDAQLAGWLRRWLAAYGQDDVVLYCSPSYLRALQRGDYVHTGPLWLSHYTLGSADVTIEDRTSAPPPAYPCDTWQWTSHGQIPTAYPGRLDLDWAPRGIGRVRR